MLPSSACGKMGSLDFRIGSMDVAGCWVLCVLFYNIGQVAPQTCQLVPDYENLTFDAVGNNQNISVVRRDSEGLAPLYRMQRLFLNAVQPNPFPQELLRELFKNTSSVETSEFVKYEAGYVTCAVITVLFFIFMLVFGLIFCIFQYRGRRLLQCEGVICQPMPIFLALLFTICFLFAGLVCTFYLNQKTHEEVGTGVQDITRTLQNFRFSVSSIPQAIGKVVSEFSVPKSRVFADLQSFSPAINRTVNAKLIEIRPLLEQAYQTARELEAAAQIVVDVNVTLVDLQKREKKLMAALRSHRENLLKVLSDPGCENCRDAADIVESVQLGLNSSQIPSVGEFLNKLSNVRKINLPAIFQKALQALNEMPKLVNSQTSRSIRDITIALNKIEIEIRSYADRIPIQKYINPVAAAVLNFEQKTTLYGQEVERYEYYRWVVGVVLCCVLLLITTCTVLGLLFGVVGLYLVQDPENSRRRQRDGSGFLLIEVYLSFIFSWLLILFVFITFLIGGNVQTLLCKHWFNGDIYKFLDDPDNLPQNINLKRQLGLRENSNFTDMYKQCKSGAPIWNVLEFNPIDLDTAFNITQYTAELQKKIDNFTVDVTSLNMMSAIAVMVLLDYKNSGVDKVPFNTILEQIQTALMTLDIGVISSALESLSSTQSNATIRSQLEKEAAALRDLQNTIVKDQEAGVRKLNNSLYSLMVLAPKLQVGIDRTIQDINTLKGPLIEGTIDLLKNEGTCLLNQAIEYFSQYLDWVKQTITQDIASCRSVSVTLDNARVIVCDHVTDPWNGFWFCLGWCTFLLIPNIFLSIKSAQHIAPKSRMSMTL